MTISGSLRRGCHPRPRWEFNPWSLEIGERGPLWGSEEVEHLPAGPIQGDYDVRPPGLLRRKPGAGEVVSDLTLGRVPGRCKCPHLVRGKPEFGRHIWIEYGNSAPRLSADLSQPLGLWGCEHLGKFAVGRRRR